MKAERYLQTALGKILLFWFSQTSKHGQFPGCSIPCLPPCLQEMSSCILAPFKLSPLLAVGSSQECQVQPRHLKERLPWQESQRQGSALPVNQTSHHDTSIGARRRQLQLKHQCLSPRSTSWFEAENKPRQKAWSKDEKCRQQIFHDLEVITEPQRPGRASALPDQAGKLSQPISRHSAWFCVLEMWAHLQALPSLLPPVTCGITVTYHFCIPCWCFSVSVRRSSGLYLCAYLPQHHPEQSSCVLYF